MNNIQKIHEALKDDPELQKKIAEEANRLVENKEANEEEALGRVVQEHLDVALTREELDLIFSRVRELAPEELAQVSGGAEEDDDYNKTVAMAGGGVIGAIAGTAFIPIPYLGTVLGGAIGIAVGALAEGGISGLFG